MADVKKKDYQLLADGMIVGGEAKQRGDTISIDAEHGERLAAHGSVGPVGILERRAEAEAKAAQLREEAERQVSDAVAALDSEGADEVAEPRRQVRRAGS